MRSRRLNPYTAMLAAFLLAACARDPTGPLSGQWVHVSAGDRFTCALDATGAAFCWGAASFGQLGNNHTATAFTPVAVQGGHLFTSISAGNDHVCAVASDGSAWCWGLDDYRELGDSLGRCNSSLPVDCSRVPVRVLGAPPVDSIVAAGFATCLLTRSHEAWCWGWSHHGQVGSGIAGDVVDHPTAVAGGRLFASLTLDIDHACGTTVAQSLFCWGSNAYGQLGADSTGMALCGVGSGFFCAVAPVAAASGLPVRSVSAGSTATCAVAVSGATWCWGSNEYGVLGNPAAVAGPLRTAVTAVAALKQVSAGHDHTCGVDPQGGAWCWGLNEYGQVGVVQSLSTCSAFGSALPCEPQPVAVAGLPPLDEISAGTSHTCAVTRGGEIWCWGRGDIGQLGNGGSSSSAAPVRVVGR